MAKIDYLLLGHISADLYPGGRRLGGTVAFAAPVARAFGHRAAVVTSASACEPLLSDLTPYAEVSLRVADETTTFENHYTPEGRVQYLHDRADSLTYDSIPVGWVDAPLVHLAPLVREMEPELVYRFPGATLILTPQGWLRRWDREGRVSFQQWLNADVLRAVDLVVLSEEDIAEAPELEAEFAAHARQVVVTRGARGGTLYREGVPLVYEAVPAEEIDPTGAGDVFAAALASAWLKLDGDWMTAVRVAARLAALSVTRREGDKALRPADVHHALAER